LVVRRQGYAEHTRQLHVQARAREPLRIELERDGSVGSEAVAGGPDLAGPIAFFAIAGAGLVTFAIAGGLALGEDSTLAAECGTGFDPPRCPPERLADLRVMTAVADVGWITGLAATAVASVWLAVALSGSGSQERAMHIAPWASAEGGGVTLMGVMK
jgi:hypothetical protein